MNKRVIGRIGGNFLNIISVEQINSTSIYIYQKQFPWWDGIEDITNRLLIGFKWSVLCHLQKTCFDTIEGKNWKQAGDCGNQEALKVVINL